MTGAGLGGYELDQIVALGPDVTRTMAAAWNSDWDWWECLHTAGVLADFDHRTVLVFSDMVQQPAVRAAFLDAVAASWSGWTVRWAYGGVDDIADYPGLTPPPPQFERIVWPQTNNGRAEGGRLVLTVDGIAYPIEQDHLHFGPSLLDRLPREPQPLEPYPRGGVHLDVAARLAGMWTLGTYEGLARSWPTMWPGWTLELWEDERAQHAARSGIRFNEITPDQARYGERLDALWVGNIAELLNDPTFYAFATAFNDAYVRPYRDLGLSTEQYQILRQRAVGARSDEVFVRARRERLEWADAALQSHRARRALERPGDRID